MSVLARLVGWLGRPLEVRRREPGPWDAIVVLGAPIRPDGSVGPVLEERLRAAVALWRAGAAPRICVSGGQTRGAAVAEAEAMAGWLREQGVAGEAIVVEAESRSTAANARKVAELLGSCRVLLVSQPFHLRRARRWFRRAGMLADAHWIEDSLQYKRARSALRWVAREYGAWLVDALRGARRGS